MLARRHRVAAALDFAQAMVQGVHQQLPALRVVEQVIFQVTTTGSRREASRNFPKWFLASRADMTFMKESFGLRNKCAIVAIMDIVSRTSFPQPMSLT